MKIIIAPDSFKECLAAIDVATTISKGWQGIFPKDEIICHPMADGGKSYQYIYNHGIEAAFSLVSGPMTLTNATSQANQLLTQCACDIARLWHITNKQE